MTSTQRVKFHDMRYQKKSVLKKTHWGFNNSRFGAPHSVGELFRGKTLSVDRRIESTFTTTTRGCLHLPRQQESDHLWRNSWSVDSGDTTDLRIAPAIVNRKGCSGAEPTATKDKTGDRKEYEYVLPQAQRKWGILFTPCLSTLSTHSCKSVVWQQTDMYLEMKNYTHTDTNRERKGGEGGHNKRNQPTPAPQERDREKDLWRPLILLVNDE